MYKIVKNYFTQVKKYHKNFTKISKLEEENIVFLKLDKDFSEHANIKNLKYNLVSLYEDSLIMYTNINSSFKDQSIFVGVKTENISKEIAIKNFTELFKIKTKSFIEKIESIYRKKIIKTEVPIKEEVKEILQEATEEKPKKKKSIKTEFVLGDNNG